MKSSKSHVVDIVFILSLLCVFTMCGLIVVFIGINVYKDTASNMQDSYSERTALAYVAKQVRQNDSVGSIELGEVEGVEALVLNETRDGVEFCKYIYYYDGYLQELYAMKSFEAKLTAGQDIIAIDGFDVTWNDDGTLTIVVVREENEDLSLTLALQSDNEE